VGISRDGGDAQRAFADKHRLDFPLLSDEDGAVADSYGVKRGLLGKLLPVKHTTFVIGTEGVIREVIRSELNMSVHADEALAVLAGDQHA
jgi:peroxiredoxin Q/BCP